MSARHDNRDRQGPDTTPFHTYRLGSVVPDNSSGRMPIGSMTHEEIYGPALRQMPACGGDCGQGDTECPHPRQCVTEDGALEMLGGMLCVVCAIVVIAAGVWVYFKYWG